MSFPDRAPLQLRASIALVLALAAFAVLAWPASAQQPDLPSEPPARPTGLTLNVSHDLVALTWDDPGDASITHYEVFRRDRDVHASGEFISITANTGSAETTYTDDTRNRCAAIAIASRRSTSTAPASGRGSREPRLPRPLSKTASSILRPSRRPRA